jgi:zinc protease
MNLCKNMFIVFLFLILSVTSHAIEPIKIPVEKYQLENGLTVLIHEDHTMPMINYQQWFRVGSSFENPGRTGLAHFFEHLMFKGTTKYPAGEIDKLIQMNGGSNNAFTTEDYTGYYTNLPSNKLELVIDIESDRMRNLIFTPDAINKEREVVKEERRMRVENSLYGSLYLAVRHLMYKTSPYRWPVIGYMSDLNATSVEELRNFYLTYYAPNNAVVVISGDVKPAEAKELIKKYYSPIKKLKLPEFKPVAEAEQMATRQSNIPWDSQGVTLAIVYPGVKVNDPDVHAIDLMMNALGAGASSRLYKKIVYKNKLATDISSYSSNKKLSGELSFMISFAPGANVKRGVKLFDLELNKLKNVELSEMELIKLKNQVMLGYIEGLETLSSRGQQLALNEILFGDYRKMFEDLKNYEAVTAADIKRVAQKYLVPEHRNNIRISPKTHLAGVSH